MIRDFIKIEIGFILILTLVGGWLRFSYLDSIPGFEFDEACAARLTKAIIEGRLLPLVGEKIYRGPLLEYCGAISCLLFGKSVFSLRLVLAIAGTLTLPLIYFILRFITKSLPVSIICSLLMAFSPWHLAVSRVYHSCCLTPFFITLSVCSFLHGLQKSSKLILILAGASIGLAMNGHFYAIFLIIPFIYVLFFHYKGFLNTNRKIFILGILAMLLMNAPLIIYNIAHSFPTVKWFLSGSEDHLLLASSTKSLSLVWKRIYGYFWTLFHSLDGIYFWLDSEWIFKGYGSPLLPYILGLSLIFNFYNFVIKREKFAGFLVIWLLSMGLTVPLITKHRIWEINGSAVMPSLPTYMDTIYPLPFLAIGYFFSSILKKFSNRYIKFSAFLLLSVSIFSFPPKLMVREIVHKFKDEGGFGRWIKGIEEVAEWIDSQGRENTAVFASPVFGEAFPQLDFLLDELPLFPTIFLPNGIYDEQGNLLHHRIFMVRKFADFKANSKIEQKVFLLPNNIPSWQVLFWNSPLVYVNYSDENLTIIIEAHSDGEKILIGEGKFWFKNKGEFRIEELRRRDIYQRNVFQLPPLFPSPIEIDPSKLLEKSFVGAEIEGIVLKDGDKKMPYQMKFLRISGKEWLVEFNLGELKEKIILPQMIGEFY